ncbi:hypothetical protein Gpo141_00010956 [Globisporangium polare]
MPRATLRSALLLFVASLFAVFGNNSVAAQPVSVVTEVVSGTIFRYPTYVSVDQYALTITASSAVVEFDILSVETKDNVTFSDVNKDCDSAYIDSHIYLFLKLPDGRLQVVGSNDDEADDYSVYYGYGRHDGSLSTQDSYLLKRLAAGNYLLAVGRYPLTAQAAANGRSTDNVDQYSPYACRARKASYGNYQLTVRTKSTATVGTIKASPRSYVGNSCSVSPAVTRQCIYRLPGDYRQAILNVCGYDKTV